MKEELQYIRTRVDEIASSVARHEAILERNTDSLEAHMKRTAQNEQMIQELMRYRYYLLGFTAAFALLVPLIWKLFFGV